ncbi:unnamed protein product [Blepharisma stoltei]|uniref:Myb-like DNA-binding domain containing protein n=1 Tax=Blepharisma stoltei TaxID=1481888 RepID=A0AAU9IK19_9CILI|nr:unnamed protein product [Blepharisma stoltei]
MMRKGKIWNEEEDKWIRELVEEFGDKNWILIAQNLQERHKVKGRTAKQCRERWHNHINPVINKEAWTKEEEKILFEYQQIYGNKWSEIARYLPGRSDNSIKNQFYSTVRKNLRRYNKKRPPNERILGKVKQILQNPAYYAILATSSEIPKETSTVRKSEDKKTKPLPNNKEPLKSPPIKNQAEVPLKDENIQDETPNILCSLYEEPKEKSSIICPPLYQPEEIKQDDIKIEPSMPIFNLANYQTEYNFKKNNMLKFPEDFPICNWDNPEVFDGTLQRGDSLGGVQEIGQEIQRSDSLQSLKKYDSSSGWKSEISMDFLRQLRASSLQSYTLPPFSPMDSFQHINMNPRNNS